MDEKTTMTEKTTLPAGWRWVKLGDVCEINPRRPSINRVDSTPTTFVQMSAVDDIDGIIARPEKKPFSDVKKGYTYFAEGDVIFAKITPCMENGKHAIARNLIDGIGFGSTEFHVIRPNQEITAEWVWHFVRQPFVLQTATNFFTGAVGQQRVPDGFLKSLEIPLPPLTEQQRIAAKLNEQMTAISQARQAAQEQLRAARALSSAYLRDVFEGQGAEKWEQKYISDFAETCSGTTPSRARNEYYDGDIPWVKTGELKDNAFDNAEEHVTELAVKETSLKLLPANTLLVAMYGQGQTRGRTGIIKKPMTINQACFAILPNETFDTEFLQFWFRNNYTRLRRETEGRGGNQPNLNGQVLKKQLVQMPKLVEQKDIIKTLKTQMLQVEQSIESLEAQLSEINQLPSALLRRAFSGEL
jgi:type I restriction enzyme S subunit